MISDPETVPQLGDDVRSVLWLFVVSALRGFVSRPSASQEPTEVISMTGYRFPNAIESLIRMMIMFDHGTLETTQEPEPGHWPPGYPEDDAFIRLLATVALAPRRLKCPIEGSFTRFILGKDVVDATQLFSDDEFERVSEIVTLEGSRNHPARQYFPSSTMGRTH